MTSQPQNWPPWQPQSPPHGLETEHRLTKIEITQERDSGRIDHHEEKHDHQDVWNKAFTVALMGLGSGLAHAKLPELIEVARQLWKGFRL
jgi:hypothetical protein